MNEIMEPTTSCNEIINGTTEQTDERTNKQSKRPKIQRERFEGATISLSYPAQDKVEVAYATVPALSVGAKERTSHFYY